MASLFPKQIRVVFDEYSVHVPYAVNLAELLGIPVTVNAPVPKRHTDEAASLLGREAWHMRAAMHRRVEHAARKYLNTPDAIAVYTAIEAPTQTRDNLYVSCDTLAHRGTPVLSPGGERVVFRGNKKGAIFVPVGDGPSGIVGTKYATVLAQRLNTNIILWHTTWRDEKVRSDDPADHVSKEAQCVLNETTMLVKESGVPVTMTIECAPTVIEGIIGAALRSGASLIVMAQGTHKEFGAYTDRVRARNCPIPMLIIPKEEA